MSASINNSSTIQFTQSLTNPREYCIGNDTYVLFTQPPSFKIITRNPFKENYKNVLEELMNGNQKVLKDYVCVYTSEQKPMKRLPFYKQFRLEWVKDCLLYTSPSPRDRTRSRMPSSA